MPKCLAGLICPPISEESGGIEAALKPPTNRPTTNIMKKQLKLCADLNELIRCRTWRRLRLTLLRDPSALWPLTV